MREHEPAAVSVMRAHRGGNSATRRLTNFGLENDGLVLNGLAQVEYLEERVRDGLLADDSPRILAQLRRVSAVSDAAEQLGRTCWSVTGSSLAHPPARNTTAFRQRMREWRKQVTMRRTAIISATDKDCSIVDLRVRNIRQPPPCGIHVHSLRAIPATLNEHSHEYER